MRYVSILFNILVYSFLAVAQENVQLKHLSTYHTGIFDEAAAEIVVYDSTNQRLYFVNANDATVEAVDISIPTAPVKVFDIDVTGYGAEANSIAIWDTIIAVAVENDSTQLPGKVVFYTLDGTPINDVDVGPLPDMLTFTPDGNKLLVANEGEPSNLLGHDPEGSVSVIDVSGGNFSALTNANVKNMGFTQFNGMPLENGIRIVIPGATFAEDAEPEYIAVDSNSKKAWVALQENNAFAIIDLTIDSIIEIVGLGNKDHSIEGNGFDASNESSSIQIKTWPVLGMYQPDAIASYSVGGQTYIVSANEGDAKDYDGFSEEDRVKDLDLDTVIFSESLIDSLQRDSVLGRLNSTIASGDTSGDGLHDIIYSYGARSFSIWDSAGNLIFDSGDDFEQILAQEIPEYFNSTNDDNDSWKNRSDDKGPEPEGIAIGSINGQAYAFIGLERVGGIMVYDITDPNVPIFNQYITSRNFDVEVDSMRGDTLAVQELGPEGLVFIPASGSPNGKNLLAVGHEVSGSVSIYEINVNSIPTDLMLSNSSVKELLPTGATIGSLTSVDDDAMDTHTYSLVAGIGDDDNSSFAISSDELNTAEVFDFETKTSYNIRIKTDDGNGGYFEKSFTITVLDSNENSTGIQFSESTPLALTPNPSSIGFIKMNKTISGKVYNILGREVVTLRNTNRINTKNWLPGIYWLESNKRESVKFIIE